MNTMNKVAKVTLYFWIMKICATTLGETGGDLLSMTMNVGYAVSSLILLGFFFVTLFIQLAAKKYNPMIYWLVIVSTSTAGTTISERLADIDFLPAGNSRRMALQRWYVIGQLHSHQESGDLLLDCDPFLKHFGHSAGRLSRG